MHGFYHHCNDLIEHILNIHVGEASGNRLSDTDLLYLLTSDNSQTRNLINVYTYINEGFE